jgi:transglutaminase/protease-like cytokinesis protein 3
VIYSAVDSSGNKTTKTITVSVLDSSESAVATKADQILASILTPGMSERDKASAIYKWMKRNVTYKTVAAVDNEIQGAYDAFFRGRGNCWTFAMGAKMLLTRAGFENMIVYRVAGTPTKHNWNLVKVNGLWYHFDTCVNPIGADTFLFGEARAAELSAKVGGMWVHKYWWYDKEKYPPIAP